MPMKVPALILTYNHERFIRQALESALAQEVDFAYEIVVSEDRSTDRTRSIVEEYALRFPQTIRLILSEHNLRSNEVVARGFRAAEGEYIALLDGDDYWTSPRKLAKQVAFLDSHPDCAICFHNAEVRGDAGREPWLWTPPGHPRISTFEDIWMGNFIATASTMYRNGLIGEIPAWYPPMFPITDWPLHILHAERGSIGYIDEVMSVYRYHEGGQYSGLTEDEKLDATATFYRVMNANLGYRHDRLVKRAHARYFFDWAREYARRGDFKRARSCFRRSVAGGGIRPSIPLSEYAHLAKRAWKPALDRLRAVRP
jgi:glycosyltransferase involved in cell wall biosynthesis